MRLNYELKLFGLGAALAFLALAVASSVQLGTGALAQTGSPFFPPGPHRTIVIWAEFPDALHTTDGSRTRRLLTNSKDSLIDYYREVSYGRLQVSVDFTNRWYMMPNNSTAYPRSSLEKSKQMLRDAIAAADNDVDFSKYDSIVVVMSSTGSKNIGCCFARGIRFNTPNRTLNAPTNDGVLVNRAAAIDESSGRTMLAIIAHEFGHILGLVDLYDSRATNWIESRRWAGGWDLMSTTRLQGPQHLAAWGRIKLGWIPEQRVPVVFPGQPQTFLTDPLEEPSQGTQVVKIPLTPLLYYFVEVRQRTGYDSVLPDSGVLITLIDESKGNADGLMRVMDAHPEAQDPAMLEQFGPHYAAPFDVRPGENSVFRDEVFNLLIRVEEKVGNSYKVTITKIF